MKFVAISLSIAMMLQLSTGASIGRVKRDTALVNGITDLIRIYKKGFPITETVVKDALTKIPKTAAHTKYRDDLEGYLAAVTEFKKEAGPCVDKTFDIITKFDELVESYNTDDAPAEAKFVYELVEGDERLKAVEAELEEWSAKFNIEDVDETLEKLTFEDAVALMPLVLEQC